MKVAILGAGLFGSIIAKELMKRGHEITCFDNLRKEAGSDPAACLMKPSWFTSMKKEQLAASRKILSSNYHYQDIRFQAGPFGCLVNWVDPRDILIKDQVIQKEIDFVELDGRLHFRDREVIEDMDVVIVALGVWCNDVLPTDHAVPNLQGRAGVAFRWKGQIEEPFIRPWAPYKQIVAFNIDEKHIWISDGTAMLRENLKPERIQKSLMRCAEAIDRDPDEAEVQIGIRPYVKGANPCYLKKLSPHVWVATGGAKNGTIAAGWCASEIGDDLDICSARKR